MADPEPGPTPRPLPAHLPNIADYWPDGALRQPSGVAPAELPDVVAFGPPETRPRTLRPALLVGSMAGLVLVSTLLLVRPMKGNDEQSRLAAPAATATTPAVPASVAPSPAASASPSPAQPTPSKAPATTTPPPKPPVITAARFELVDTVTELSVRTADLDGVNFKVTTPKGSGLDVGTSFKDGTLKVSAEPDGSDSGNGRVDVVLDEDIVWKLKMGAGVRTASFDMGTGTVSDIDLVGGARTVDIELGRLDGTLPILMAGGVRTWTISTADEVPVAIAVTGGAGSISVYGEDLGGVEAGDQVRRGDQGGAGLDIDAEAGLGVLEITRE